MYEIELYRGEERVVLTAPDREAAHDRVYLAWSPQVTEAVVRKDGQEVYRWERACPACRSEAEHRDGCPFDTRDPKRLLRQDAEVNPRSVVVAAE